MTGGGNGLSLNNSIDPFKLIPGEYVVHRKFGIGKFLGIRSIDRGRGARERDHRRKIGPAPKIGFLFIEYADAQAKIRPEKAAAQLYRFASPARSSRVKPRSCRASRTARAGPPRSRTRKSTSGSSW